MTRERPTKRGGRQIPALSNHISSSKRLIKTINDHPSVPALRYLLICQPSKCGGRQITALSDHESSSECLIKTINDHPSVAALILLVCLSFSKFIQGFRPVESACYFKNIPVNKAPICWGFLKSHVRREL